MRDLGKYFRSDLGINSEKLLDEVSKHSNKIFVDLGVRSGISSEIMLLDSVQNNNKVFGVDVDWSHLDHWVNSHENYTKLLGDSVTIGKNWDKSISGLFVDTFHIKEQVLCELYFWYKHVEEGGFIAFHDSNWPAGKQDVYGGISWGRVEEGIKDFFNISELDYEDDYIKMTNYPESWGMTIVQLKKKKDYVGEYDKWNDIFSRRNQLISLFWNENNKSGIDIDLVINV
jgi:hypothetical protein